MRLTQVLAFTLGILGVHALPQLPPFWLLALLLLACAWPWRGRAWLLPAAAGVALTVWHAQDGLDARWPAERHGEDHWVQGHIASLPDESPRATRFVFEPWQSPELPRRIRASWYRAEQSVRAGECWRFELRLRSPHGSLNPGAFDYEGWLFRERLHATASVRRAERCELPPRYPLLRLRQAWRDQLVLWLPEHPGRPLLAALTIGDQDALGNSDWDLFRVTGTSHLVVISGLHLAIVAGFAYLLLRGLWSLVPALCLRLPAQRAGLIGAALVAALYALIAGFEAPVQRALLMLWLVLLAALAGRLHQPLRVLALAWVGILLFQPLAITSPGLWLSFGAVGAIIYVSTRRLRTPAAWRLALLIQLMLGLMLMPLTLGFFKGATWLALPVNLVAVPLFGLFTPVLFVATLLALAWPDAGAALLWACAEGLAHFQTALGWLALHAPGGWWDASPSWAALALALAGAILLFAPRGLPTRLPGLLCLLPLLLPPSSAPRADFSLAMLDVGQGLAVVVRTANHTLLYDAGPAFEDGFDAGRSIVLPYLLHEQVRHIDRLVLSHRDNDHAGGVDAVRARLPITEEIGTEQGRPCRRGEQWEWDGVRFEILHPEGGDGSRNDQSCVLRVQGRWTVLLAGDIEARAERQLLARDAQALRADVLVAPHHGSKTSSTPAFVAAVRPQVVLYGAGWRHHYRHPRPEVTARYAELGARQWVSGVSGALRVTQEGGDIRVSEWRREAGRWWNAPPEP